MLCWARTDSRLGLQDTSILGVLRQGVSLSMGYFILIIFITAQRTTQKYCIGHEVCPGHIMYTKIIDAFFIIVFATPARLLLFYFLSLPFKVDFMYGGSIGATMSFFFFVISGPIRRRKYNLVFADIFVMT